MIYEHQCTIIWFLDNSKVSHTDDIVNSMIAENIEEKSGKLFCTTEKKHTFLGTEIKFIGGKRAAVSTPHHVYKSPEYFGETLKGNMVNPATSQLSAITSESKELDDEKEERYYLITAKIFWIMKCSRPDLETVVNFFMHKGAVPNQGILGKT